MSIGIQTIYNSRVKSAFDAVPLLIYEALTRRMHLGYIVHPVDKVDGTIYLYTSWKSSLLPGSHLPTLNLSFHHVAAAWNALYLLASDYSQFIWNSFIEYTFGALLNILKYFDGTREMLNIFWYLCYRLVTVPAQFGNG